jgi:alkylation response protein AidB-like acyl-CoA dehydrogenase
MVWVGAVMGLEEQLAQLLHDAPALLDRLAPIERAIAVDQIVQVAIDTQAARCLGYRGFAKLARGGTAPEQALMKLYASEARQRLALTAAEIQGADAVESGSVALDGHLAIDEPQGTWLEQYFVSFANTISAGASEIQRNIIAERVLGLPRG